MLTADRFLRSGKVRDLFELPDGRLVLVASDRLSAFDVILPTTIPDKGRVLTGLSRFWFDETRAIVPNHLLDTDPDVVGDAFLATLEANATAPPKDWPDTFVFEEWRGRVMVCQPATVLPLEAVVRGYLSGSAWTEYRETGAVCGIELRPGLLESDPLPEPIFTPATKAPAGEHDRNVSFDEAIEHVAANYHRSAVGDDAPTDVPRLSDQQAGLLVERTREAAIKLYRYGAAVAAKAGIILADTKFEFGVPRVMDFGRVPSGPREEWIERRRPLGHTLGDTEPGEPLILIDEALTPDSSRLWDAATYLPGGSQASFDKQFVRDWLERQDWDKTAPGPELPPDVIEGTRARYVEAFERITGASFERYLREDILAPEARP